MKIHCLYTEHYLYSMYVFLTTNALEVIEDQSGKVWGKEELADELIKKYGYERVKVV